MIFNRSFVRRTEKWCEMHTNLVDLNLENYLKLFSSISKACRNFWSHQAMLVMKVA